MGMKTNKDYGFGRIPAWVNYITKDRYGKVVGHYLKPVIDDKKMEWTKTMRNGRKDYYEFSKEEVPVEYQKEYWRSSIIKVEF